MAELSILFGDDSVQKGHREGMDRVVSFGGVIVPGENLADLGSSLDEVCKRARFPAGEEFKWSPNRNHWMFKGLVGDDRLGFQQAILETAGAHNARALIVSCDEALSKIPRNWAEKDCVEYALERYSKYCNDNNMSGLIITDVPRGDRRSEYQFLEETWENLTSGNNYVLQDALIPFVLTAASKYVRHLQLADLVVGVTTAMVAGAEEYSAPLFPLVKTLLLTNATSGLIGGTGLKVFKGECHNLYHHVLGEDRYFRYGTGECRDLPDPKLPYG